MTVISVATPIINPSTVNAARSLCARMESTASATLSPTWITASGSLTCYPAPIRSKNRPILTLFLAALCLIGLDALVFRTRRYTPWLQPESSTGTFEFILWREQRAQLANPDDMVVTLGDSRFAY